MVEVGESTGALQDMLNALADFYDEDIETAMARFVTLVEPALLVIMGLVIAAPAAGALHAGVPAVERGRLKRQKALPNVAHPHLGERREQQADVPPRAARPASPATPAQTGE